MKANKEQETITFIDLFCGIGGFHTGLKCFKCVFACDIDKDCQNVYCNNYNIQPEGDIFTINPFDIPKHHILCAGFPCQPFSSAGKKKGFFDERSKTYEKLIDIIGKKQPNIIILENVKNLTLLNNGLIFQKIIQDLCNLNYNVSFSVLNVSNFGLPQNRERVFIVAVNKTTYKNKYFSFKNLDCIQINKTLKDFLNLENTNYIDTNNYILLDKKSVTKQKSGLIFCGYIKGNLRTKGVSPNTEHLSRVHKQPNRIYHIDGVHPTLSSGESSGRYFIYDEKGVRSLTIDECYLIMGFHNFQISNQKSKSYQQIGNSVCPVIVEYIKNELIKQNFLPIQL